MTRINPALTESINMAAKSEHKQSNLDNPGIQSGITMRTCLSDITFKIARPLIISMSIFGLLHFSGKERRWAPITKVYSTLVLLITWAMFVRYFTLYGNESFGQFLIFKLVMHSWIFLCTAAATSTYMACRRQNKLVVFLTRWSKLIQQNHGCGQEDDSLHKYVRKANISFNSFLIFGWVGTLLTCGSIGYSVFKTTFIDFMLHPMEPTHPQALLLKCLLFVVSVYNCAAWEFILCLFYSMGSVIYKEFMVFHLDFQKAVQSNGDTAFIGNYRRRHKEICLLVENADDILSGFSVVSILMAMVLGMLILYNMIWYPDQYHDGVVLVSNIFWILSYLLYLGVIAVGGAYLNHMAHLPSKAIHNIQLKTFTTETSLQMTMFLSKLTGESIGLTAMGMFVIDKPTILTIAGVFLTYFVVLAQFQQPSVQQEALRNCTVSIPG